MVEYCVSNSGLRDLAANSMTERVRIINEKFNTTSLTPYLLKRLYK